MVIGMLGVLVACGGGDDAAADDEATDEPAAAVTTTTEDTTPTTEPPPPGIVYEVTGSGTVAVNYAIAGNRLQAAEITLPWSEAQAEDPGQASILVALAGSQGDVTCRILRGDEVLAEQTLSIDTGPLLSCDHPPSGLPPVTYPPGFEG